MKQFEETVQSITKRNLKVVKNMFDNLPIDKQCYASADDEHAAALEIQSIQSSIDNLIELLERGIELGL